MECFQPLRLIADHEKLVFDDDFVDRFAGNFAQFVIRHHTDIRNDAVAREQQKTLLQFTTTDDGDGGIHQLLGHRQLTHNTKQSR